MMSLLSDVCMPTLSDGRMHVVCSQSVSHAGISLLIWLDRRRILRMGTLNGLFSQLGMD